MAKVFKIFSVLFLLIFTSFLLPISNSNFTPRIYADYESGSLGGSGGGSDLSDSMSKDNTSPSGDWAVDFSNTGGENQSDPGNPSDFSNDTGSQQNFSDFVDSVGTSDAGGQSFDTGGTPTGHGGIGSGLSNIIDTIDNNGVTASYDALDPGVSNWPGPILSASAGCINYKPVVHLSWVGAPISGNSPGGTKWVVLRSGMTPSYFQPVNEVNQMSKDDATVAKRTIYYYRVYSWNGDRSKLSNIMAVYTPECPLSGYVYNDLNQNGVLNYYPPSSSGGAFVNDPGIPGETVQIIRNAYMTPGGCYVTSTDENGNPTGEACDPDIPNPPAVMWSGQSDASGFYTITGITPEPQRTYTVKHARDPLLPGWIRVNPLVAEVALPVSANPAVSYGLYSPIAAPPPGPTPPPKPIIRLKLNGSDLTEIQVNKNTTGVTLGWQVANATSCTATSNPSKSYWSGAPNSVVNPVTTPTGAYQPLDTQTVGSFRYTLTCTNTNSAGLSSSDQYIVTLNVRPILKPYIQTTGGDVHTNESINIPE